MTTENIMALNADGFHSCSLEKGSTLEDSEISFTGDDFLNLWSGAYAVCKQLGSGDESDGSGSGGVSSLLIVDTHNAWKTVQYMGLLARSACFRSCEAATRADFFQTSCRQKRRPHSC